MHLKLFIKCYISSHPQDQDNKRHFSHNYLTEMTKEAIFNDRKRTELMKIWPSLIVDMVKNSLTEMSDMDAYMKRSLDELERS